PSWPRSPRSTENQRRSETAVRGAHQPDYRLRLPVPDTAGLPTRARSSASLTTSACPGRLRPTLLRAILNSVDRDRPGRRINSLSGRLRPTKLRAILNSVDRDRPGRRINSFLVDFGRPSCEQFSTQSTATDRGGGSTRSSSTSADQVANRSRSASTAVDWDEDELGIPSTAADQVANRSR